MVIYRHFDKVKGKKIASMNVPQQISELRQLIEASRKMVVFTGAGISTESGIPDFRGPDGIWNKIKPIEFGDFIASEEVRRESWRRKFNSASNWGDAEPNAGHMAISRLVGLGRVAHIITQNVDGLHQKSGVPDDQVIELHGNNNYAVCLECGKRYDFETLKAIFFPDETLPYCDECQGIIKTATISFGQPMPVTEMQLAEAATLACDLFMAIGSSLVVYPAAGFPVLAKNNGAKLVILNRDATDLDPICDLVLNEEIGPTLSAAID